MQNNKVPTTPRIYLARQISNITLPGSYLTFQVAKTQWVAVNTEMEKMREKYKTCVFKKTYLRLVQAS